MFMVSASAWLQPYILSAPRIPCQDTALNILHRDGIVRVSQHHRQAVQGFGFPASSFSIRFISVMFTKVITAPSMMFSRVR